jgi:RHS repeat-associated protein
LVVAAALALAGLASAVAFGSGGPPARRHHATATPDPSRIVGEVVSMRSRRSRTFRRADGSFVTESGAGPMNFKAASGKWTPIDTTLRSTGDGGFAPGSVPYDLRLPESAGGSVSLKSGNWQVSFKVVGATGDAALSGSRATYASAFGGSSVQYEAGSDALKETLALSSASAPADYRFSLSFSPGLHGRVTSEGSFVLADGSGNPVFTVPAPTAVDGAAGAVPSRSPVRYSFDAGTSLLSLHVDEAWLASAKRVFPVRIDPTWWLHTTEDCGLYSGYGADQSHCFEPLYIGADNNPSFHDHRAILRFDLSDVPKDAVITQSVVQLWFAGNSSDHSNSTIDLYRLTQGFTNDATWNKYDGTHTWATPGGDLGGKQSSMSVLDSQVGDWISWNAEPLTQDWVSGKVANQGVLLRATDENALNVKTFDDADTGSNQPLIRVTWKPRLGLPKDGRFETQQLTDRSSVSVNVANGNLIYASHDVELPGIGHDFVFDRYYNVAEDGLRGELGNNWSLSGGADMSLQRLWPGEGRVLHAPSGMYWRFDRDPGKDSGTDKGYDSPPGVNADLVEHSDGTDSLTFHQSGTKWEFDSFDPGYLVHITDRNNNSIDFSYDTSGNSTITDTRGTHITFSYDPTTQDLSQITDALNRHWQYHTDSNHRLLSATDPDGKETDYTYDANGALSTITDPNGQLTVITYNPADADQVASIRRVVNGTATSVGSDDVTTSFTYKIPDSACTASGVIGETVVTDPRGHDTTYCWDASDEVRQTKDALGHEADTSYTSNADVLTYASPGQKAGNLGLDTEFAYNGDQALSSVVQKTDTNKSLTTTLSYDTTTGNPNPLKRFVPSTIQTPRSESSQAPGDHSVALSYDGQGNLSGVSDHLASQHDVTIHHGAPGGQVDYSIDADGNRTDYTYYSTTKDLHTIVPPSPTGDPLGSTTITYDAVGRVRTVTDGKSQTRTYTYDGEDRVTRVDYSDGSYVTFGYDGDGNELSRVDSPTISSWNGTSTYHYDKLNRLTETDLPTGTNTTYGYDKSGNLASLTDPGGTVSYSYGATNLLTSLTEPNGASSASFSYNEDGFRTQTDLPNGLRVCTTPDNADRLKTLQTFTASAGTCASPPSSKLQDYTLDYSLGADDSAVLQTLTDHKHNDMTGYTYDVLDRLSQAQTTGTDPATYAYTYDGVGNMTRRTTTVGTTSDSYYAYNSANELCRSSSTGPPSCPSSPASTDPAYDANGNQTRDGNGRTTAYNIRDQITSITPSGGTATSLVHRGTSQEDLAEVGGSEVESNILGIGYTANPANYYTHDNAGQLIAQRTTTSTPSQTKYFLQDPLGSVAALTNASGAQTDPSATTIYTYDPYGRSVGTAPSTFGWLSAYRAPGGLIHFGYRYYDRNLAGTWTQREPVQNAVDIVAQGQYTYAGDDPIALVDLDGTRRQRRNSPNIDYRHSVCTEQTCLPRRAGATYYSSSSSDDGIDYDVTCAVDSFGAAVLSLPTGGLGSAVFGSVAGYVCSKAN